MLLKYNMFDELKEEFRGQVFPAERILELEEREPANELDTWSYSASLELPYGTYESTLLFKNTALEGEDADKMNEVQASLLEYFNHRCKPKPTSRGEQQEIDDKEEQDNKQREKEARDA